MAVATRPRGFTDLIRIMSEEVPVVKLRLQQVIQKFRHEDHPQQREKRIEHLVAHWDDAKCSPLFVVAEADGSRAVCRGGHRMEAARRLRLGALRCEVVYGLDLSDPEQLSWLIERTLAQEETRGFTAFNRYALSVQAGLEPEAGIERTLYENGARTSPSSGQARAYACVDKLRKPYEAGHLFPVIFVIETAWRRFDKESPLEARAARSAPMVDALGMFVGAYASHANFDEHVLAERLAVRSPQALVVQARTASSALRLSLTRALCQDLLAIYNKGKRDKQLPAFKMPRKKG